MATKNSQPDYRRYTSLRAVQIALAEKGGLSPESNNDKSTTHVPESLDQTIGYQPPKRRFGGPNQDRFVNQKSHYQMERRIERHGLHYRPRGERQTPTAGGYEVYQDLEGKQTLQAVVIQDLGALVNLHIKPGELVIIKPKQENIILFYLGIFDKKPHYATPEAVDAGVMEDSRFIGGLNFPCLEYNGIVIVTTLRSNITHTRSHTQIRMGRDYVRIAPHQGRTSEFLKTTVAEISGITVYRSDPMERKV